MALLDYVELAATVRELIEGTGRSITFNKFVDDADDPSKPWKPSGATVGQVTFGTFVPPSSAADFGMSISDEELFRRAEQVLLCGTIPLIDLASYNTLTDRGVTWRVQWVYELKPGDTVLLYAFGVKQ